MHLFNWRERRKTCEIQLSQLCLDSGKGAGLPGTDAGWENNFKMAEKTLLDETSENIAWFI